MGTRMDKRDAYLRVPEELGMILGIRRYLAYTIESLVHMVFNPRKDPYKVALEIYRFLVELKEHALSLPLSTLAYMGVITIPLPLVDLNNIKRKLLLRIENALSRSPREYGVTTISYLANPIKLVENVYKELSIILDRYKLSKGLETYLAHLERKAQSILKLIEGTLDVKTTAGTLYSYTTDVVQLMLDAIVPRTPVFPVKTSKPAIESTVKSVYPSITLESRRALDIALTTLYRIRRGGARGLVDPEEIARFKTSLSELESQVTISKVSLIDAESMLRFLERRDIDDSVKRAVILGKLYAKASSSILALTEEIIYAKTSGRVIDKSKIKAKVYKHKHSINKIFENLEQLSRMNKLPVKHEAISLVKKNVVEPAYNQVLETLAYI